jgi:two-component system sensor histidine kinase KdpD
MSDSTASWRDRALPTGAIVDPLPRVIAGLAFVGVVGGVLGAASAGLSLASVSMLVAVVGAALLGYASGLVAAVAGFFVLNYFFTNPVGSLVIARIDDLFLLIAFVAVSVVVSGVVARLNALRVRSERTGREVQLRLALANQLMAGAVPASVMEFVARELVSLYELASCSFARDAVRVSASGAFPAFDQRELLCGSLTVEIGLGRGLASDELAAINALGTELATALDRADLEDEVIANRVSVDLARMRAGFLTAVTHDLRTPLATIKASAAALLFRDSPFDGDERQELLEAVYEESAELAARVTKVLEFTRVRSGELQPERVSVAPGDLAGAAAARLSRVPGGDHFDLAVDSCLPTLDVDPVMLEHVLVNLFENAIRYGDSEHGVRVEGAAVGAAVELRVIDRGPGIPATEHERVFEEFVRLPSEEHGMGLAEERGGMGLGLPIARAFVGAHGGALWCEPTPGGGATFVVSVPTTAATAP